MAMMIACAGGGESAGGDVASSVSDSVAAAPESTPARGTWLDDANVLALVGVIDARQIDAANVELGGWHSDTVRAFAASMVAEHDAMRHTADSLAAVLRIAPVMPALADSISAQLQTRIDSLRGQAGDGLERAYVAEQVATDQMARSYLDGLAGIAERPEVQALVAGAEKQTASELDRARALQVTMSAADTSRADSSARARARRPN